MGYYSPPGMPVGVAYQVWLGSTVIAGGVPLLTLDVDGWVSLRPAFTPLPGRTYTLTIRANQETGIIVQRTLTLVYPKLSTNK